MPEIYKYHIPPENSLISKDFGRIDYCDSYQTIKSTDETIDKITTEIFRMPNWVNLLIKIRGFLVRPFGLVHVNGLNFTEFIHYPIGLKVGYSSIVIDRSDNEIVIEMNDKHLNFRLSIMKKKIEQDCSIYVTTIVKFNNIGGRIYFLLIKPFHKIIVKSLLKQYL